MSAKPLHGIDLRALIAIIYIYIHFYICGSQGFHLWLVDGDVWQSIAQAAQRLFQQSSNLFLGSWDMEKAFAGKEEKGEHSEKVCQQGWKDVLCGDKFIETNTVTALIYRSFSCGHLFMDLRMWHIFAWRQDSFPSLPSTSVPAPLLRHFQGLPEGLCRRHCSEV